MWVLSGDGSQMVNIDKAHRVFCNSVGDAVLIGVDFGPGTKVAALGKYLRMDTALKIMAELVTEESRDYYIMPNNKYDLVMEHKIMDSRVKRRGGS